jgi:polysaccharide export outer membrane protein
VYRCGVIEKRKFEMVHLRGILVRATVTAIAWTIAAGAGAPLIGQTREPAAAATAQPADAAHDYVIGAGDVLAVRFWRRDDVSADVVVRPDGKISLLLLDDIPAAGLTPEQLRDRIVQKANLLFEDARVTIVVKEVNSRQVFITGLVARPGPYPLRRNLTILQLIATAGGLLDFANGERIGVVRTVNGRQIGFPFNYKEVNNFKKLEQNIELQPGDTVVVP